MRIRCSVRRQLHPNCNPVLLYIFLCVANTRIASLEHISLARGSTSICDRKPHESPPLPTPTRPLTPHHPKQQHFQHTAQLSVTTIMDHRNLEKQDEPEEPRYLDFPHLPDDAMRDGKPVLNKYSQTLTKDHDFPGARKWGVSLFLCGK